MKKKISLTCIGLLILFGACKKDRNQEKITLENTNITSTVNTNFNWETATQMEVSPTVPAANVPSLPWQTQSGSPINANLLQDFSYNDGWRLVYNTFNNTVLPYSNSVPAGGLYFTLYNIYRGIMRFYVYLPPGYVNNNANIEHGLSVYTSNGTTTKMLNFDGTDLVDPSASANSFTKTNDVAVASGGGWYAMQYEIAYDPLFAATTFPNLGFVWNSKTISISEIKLNGTIISTPGNAAKQNGGSFDWTGGIATTAKVIQLFGSSDADAKPAPFQKIISALAGGLAGNVVNFFSGIFGGNSSSPASADLKINANVTLNGTLTSSQPLVPNSLVVPGQTVGNTIGAAMPLYTNVLGVFNISGRPKIKITGSMIPVGTDLKHRSSFSIIPGSYTVQINPNVAAVATVQEMYHEILLPEFIAGPVFYNYFGSIAISKEEIGSTNYYRLQQTGSSINGRDFPEVGLAGAGKAVVRFVFRVTPNNGAPASTIVKTFLADLSTFELKN